MKGFIEVTAVRVPNREYDKKKIMLLSVDAIVRVLGTVIVVNEMEEGSNVYLDTTEGYYTLVRKIEEATQ